MFIRIELREFVKAVLVNLVFGFGCFGWQPIARHDSGQGCSRLLPLFRSRATLSTLSHATQGEKDNDIVTRISLLLVVLFGVIGLGGKTARKKRENMNERKALEGLQIDKENFESFFKNFENSLAPDVWERVCKEIDGRVENFVIELMINLAEEIEENGYEYE